MNAPENIAGPIELLYVQGELLDERRWDAWLQLHTEDCQFWMPMWRDDHTLNDDPLTSLSHIYYDSRRGLEDRIARITSPKRSPASFPLPRTTHIFGSVRTIDAARGAASRPVDVRLKASWACHVLSVASRKQHTFFGSCEFGLRETSGGWLIADKRVLLQNDDIPAMLDIYCV
jgi:3-phenylpropionate/cinnamic acid dioxygenase small subunit